MEELVDVLFTRQFDLNIAKGRCKRLLYGLGKGLTQSQGQRGFLLTLDLYLTLISIAPEEVHACV